MGFTKNTKYYETIVYEFNLPTGWACPYADECLVKVDRETGKQNNLSGAYKCYASSAERFPSARKSRWGNFDMAKAGLIPPLPKQAKYVRIHSSGDFFSQEYFDLWLAYIRKHAGVKFWAYTKSLKYWVARKNELPSNLVLTASTGGKLDHMIAEHDLRYTVIIDKPEDAEALGMGIDENDNLARHRGGNFAQVNTAYRPPASEKLKKI